jgi:hypothetical protein
MKIHPVTLDLLQAYRRTSPEMTFIKPDCVINSEDIITHA